MIPFRPRLLRLAKGPGKVEKKCCIAWGQGRAYAQTFGSPLNGFDSLLTSLVTEQKRNVIRRFVPNGVEGSSGRHLTLEGQPKSSLPSLISPSRRSLQIGERVHLAILLRDACTCPKCVDPSSTQKNFQTTDFPPNVRVKTLEEGDNGTVRITWENDLPGFEDHVSVFQKDSISHPQHIKSVIRDRTCDTETTLWGTAAIKERLEYVSFKDYMTDDQSLWRALWQLSRTGLLIIRDVPKSEKSVEDLALRIGNIRDSLYGRTWDVKSIPDAKNVAYTSKYLGLHMDLLYMANPPGFQFLHCLKNTAEGGASLFSDAFNAARYISGEHLKTLSETPVAYHYQNAGEHYYHTHPLVEIEPQKSGWRYPPTIRFVNYSPPFQANYLLPSVPLNQSVNFLKALWAFTRRAEDKRNVLEYKLQEGECVIFNNRRILHGRGQFNALGGERWLKGTYVDTDVFLSKYRVLEQAFYPQVLDPKGAKYVFERAGGEINTAMRSPKESVLADERALPLEETTGNSSVINPSI